jgi:hypothetical protein
VSVLQQADENASAHAIFRIAAMARPPRFR